MSLIRRQKDEVVDIFEFVPLCQNGVRLFSSKKVLPIRYYPGICTKDVCEQAAIDAGISPVSLPFFTLETVEGGHVLPLQKELTKQECNQDHYEFRFVFKGCNGFRFASTGLQDQSAFEYVFHQYRHDFLKRNSTIEFSTSKENDRRNFVRAVICEIIYNSRNYSETTSHVLDHAKRFSIHHLLQRGLFSDRKLKEVKEYLKRFIHKFEHLSDIKLKREYMRYIEESQDFFVHLFEVTQVETYGMKNGGKIVICELLISPKFGIKKKIMGSEVEVTIVDSFEEISMLELDQDNSIKIHISRARSTQVFSTSSPEDKHSIVAIIDGYYKLLVNRYKDLYDQGKTSSPICHGPITIQTALSKLEEDAEDEIEDGVFLIRESRNNYNELVLSVYHDDNCENYSIFKECNQCFLESNTDSKFKDLDELIKHHKISMDGLPCCLLRNCPPSDEGLDALLAQNKPVPTSARRHDLSQFGIEPLSSRTITLHHPPIGQGKYGLVIKADWKKKDKENAVESAIRVMKWLGTYDERFFSVVKELKNLKHPNVIRFFGVVRKKFDKQLILGLVMDFFPQPLDTFLLDKYCEHGESLTVQLLVHYASQIAEGMMFLQNKMNYNHGHLCAHTILINPKRPGHVKISDVGLKELEQHGGQFLTEADVAISQRHCWHAPEILIYPESPPTHESDVWALGDTIWEMFTLKKPFHRKTQKCLTREEILTWLVINQKYLDTQRNAIPVEVAKVIEKCWRREPEYRITCKNVIKELRDFLLCQDAQERLNRPLTLDNNYVELWENQFLTVVQVDIAPQNKAYVKQHADIEDGASQDCVDVKQNVISEEPPSLQKHKSQGSIEVKKGLQETASLQDIQDSVDVEQDTILNETRSPQDVEVEDKVDVKQDRLVGETGLSRDGGAEHSMDVEQATILEETCSPQDAEFEGTVDVKQGTILEEISCSQDAEFEVTVDVKQGTIMEETCFLQDAEFEDTVDVKQGTTSLSQDGDSDGSVDFVLLGDASSLQDSCPPTKIHASKPYTKVSNVRFRLPISTNTDHNQMLPDLTQDDCSTISAYTGSYSYADEIVVDVQREISKLEEELSRPFIHKQNLSVKSTPLGTGSFGIVKKGILIEKKIGKTSEKMEVAVKELNEYVDNKSRADFFQEVKNLESLTEIENTYFIKFVGVCVVKDEEKVMIVTELAPLGDLKTYLNKNRATMTTSVLLNYCHQICSGMHVLEMEGILHRDLALRNILVMTENHVKISDFGLSKLTDYYRSEKSGKWPRKWYAPESIAFEQFTSKSDVWSFGVLLWEMFSYGEKPYRGIRNREVFDYIKQGKRLECPDHCPDDIYQVMKECWMYNPMTRPTFFFLCDTLSDLKTKYH